MFQSFSSNGSVDRSEKSSEPHSDKTSSPVDLFTLVTTLVEVQGKLLAALEAEKQANLSFRQGVMEKLDGVGLELKSLAGGQRDMRALAYAMCQEQKNLRLQNEEIRKDVARTAQEASKQAAAMIAQKGATPTSSPSKEPPQPQRRPTWEVEKSATESLVLLMRSARSRQRESDVGGPLPAPSEASAGGWGSAWPFGRVTHTASRPMTSEDVYQRRLVASIRAGADVLHHPLGMRGPLLHLMAASGNLTAWRITMMEYGQELDLTVRDTDGRTPLHLLCWQCPCETAARAMLEALVARLLGEATGKYQEEKTEELRKAEEETFGTRVDWEQQSAYESWTLPPCAASTMPPGDPEGALKLETARMETESGAGLRGTVEALDWPPATEALHPPPSTPVPQLDFINGAVAHGRFKLFWPVLRRLPYFRDAPERSILLDDFLVLEPSSTTPATAQPQGGRTPEVDSTSTYPGARWLLSGSRVLSSLQGQEMTEKEAGKFLTRANATTALVHISMASHWRPNMAEVRRCVAFGADVTDPHADPQLAGKPLLSYYVEYAVLDVVRVLLTEDETNPAIITRRHLSVLRHEEEGRLLVPLSGKMETAQDGRGEAGHRLGRLLDLTRGDPRGCTPLHWISWGTTKEGFLSTFGVQLFDATKSESDVAQLLHLFLDCIEKGEAMELEEKGEKDAFTTPSKRNFATAVGRAPTRVKVDWSRQDVDGDDCLSWAAHAGFLPLWWRTVMAREVSYYVHLPRPIHLTLPVKQSGWNCLSREEKECFTVGKGFC